MNDPSFRADLNANISVKLADGTECPVKTAFVLIKEELAKVHPKKQKKLPVFLLLRFVLSQKNLANFKGVIDDGWYSAKNGTGRSALSINLHRQRF